MSRHAACSALLEQALEPAKDETDLAVFDAENEDAASVIAAGFGPLSKQGGKVAVIEQP